MFDRLKSALRRSTLYQALVLGTSGAPPDPGSTFLVGAAPGGLELLHSTVTVAEAEMLSQVLTEAGFHIEFVPSARMGVFGTSGSNSIYVRTEEFEEAQRFLKEFLESEPLPEEE